MSEMTSLPPSLVALHNDQRHDAALTVAEMSHGNTDLVAYYLVLLGLAREVDRQFFSDGHDEYEMPWFIPCADTGASARSPGTPPVH